MASSDDVELYGSCSSTARMISQSYKSASYTKRHVEADIAALAQTSSASTSQRVTMK